MSDYTPVNDFSAKDSLATGESEKLILGSDMDAETVALQTAINSKYDSDDLATQAEAQAGTNNAALMTPLRAEEHIATYLAEGAAMVADLKAIADPGADRIFFWDDSDNALEFLITGTGLAITTNTLNWSASGITGHDTFSDFVSDEHVLHAGVIVTAGAGMTGGGNISATITLDCIGGDGITVNANDIACTFSSGAEAIAGTSAVRVLNPLTLNDVFFSATFTSGSSAVTNESAGWTPSAVDTATGITTVTHGLGTADYNIVVANSDGSGTGHRAASGAKGATTFQVYARDSNDALIDAVEIDVIIMKH